MHRFTLNANHFLQRRRITISDRATLRRTASLQAATRSTRVVPPPQVRGVRIEAAAAADRSMGSTNLTTTIRLLAAAALATAALLALPASGQQQPQPAGAAASCTASLLTSFTPCFSFLTSSNGSSTPPTRECCRSLAALVNASTGCACLVLTGAVPLGVPVNRTLAVSLPRACDSMSVPLQCRDTSSAQTPAPGPVADTPSATTPASPAATTPATPTAADPTATAPVSQGQTRPMVLPSSARRTTSAHVAAAPALALLLAVAAALV